MPVYRRLPNPQQRERYSGVDRPADLGTVGVIGAGQIIIGLGTNAPLQLTLQPDATAGVDAVANEALPTTNNGTSTGMALGGKDSSGGRSYAHLKFDLSSIPAGSNCEGSSFVLTTAATTTALRTYEIWKLVASNAGWTETGMTWNTRDGTTAWTGGALGGGVEGTDVETPVLATADYAANDPIGTMLAFTLPQAAIAAAFGGTLCLVVKRQGVTTTTSPTLRSSDSSITNERPRLLVTYSLAAVAVTFSPSVVAASTVSVGLTSPALLTPAVAAASTISSQVCTAALLAPAVVAASTVAISLTSPALLTIGTIQQVSLISIDLGGPVLLTVTVVAASTVIVGVGAVALLTVQVSSATIVRAGLVQYVTPSSISASSVAVALSSPALLVTVTAGAGVVSATISSIPRLTGSITSSTTASVQLTSPALVAATVSSASSLTAQVVSPARLAASVVAVSSVLVAVRSTPYLAPVITAASIVDCSLGGPARLTVTISGSTSCTILLTSTPRLNVAVLAASTSSSLLTSPAQLAASISSSTSVVVTRLISPAQLLVQVAAVSTVLVQLSAPLVPFLAVQVVSDTLIVVKVTVPVVLAPVISSASVVSSQIVTFIPPVEVRLLEVSGRDDSVQLVEGSDTGLYLVPGGDQSIIEVTGSAEMPVTSSQTFYLGADHIVRMTIEGNGSITGEMFRAMLWDKRRRDRFILSTDDGVSSISVSNPGQRQVDWVIADTDWPSGVVPSAQFEWAIWRDDDGSDVPLAEGPAVLVLLPGSIAAA